MTAPLKIESSKATILQADYERIAHDTLRILWRRKLLIGALPIAALLLSSIALVLTGPSYKAEATIQLNFDQEEQHTASTRTQPIPSVDAIALVNSAALAIRSRATATAVVTQLSLDQDPNFAPESLLQRVLSDARTALGLNSAPPSPRDVAVSQLLKRLTVTTEPRSYFISIAFTTRDPEQSARLVNAVALEYLRGQMLQQVADARAAVERDLAQLSSVYGVGHPNYVLGRRKLENLESRLSALRDRSLPGDALKLVIGQSFVPAERNTVPSGPNIKLILGLAVGAGLAVGIWLALLLSSDRRIHSNRLAYPEQTDFGSDG
jgi:uncharacterized protein involved in exopolysaccharide biosynthesis